MLNRSLFMQVLRYLKVKFDIVSFDILGKVRPSAIRARTWSSLSRLLAPTIVENVCFVHAESSHGNLRMIRFDVHNDVSFGSIRVRRWLLFRDIWWTESILSLRN